MTILHSQPYNTKIEKGFKKDFQTKFHYKSHIKAIT